MNGDRRALVARLAAHESWAQTRDRSARTAPGRAAFEQTFEHVVDPNGEMTPRARALAAESARRAHFARMALRSAQARRARAAARKRGDARSR